MAAISGNRVCVGGRQTVSISNDFGKTWSSSQVTADSRVEVSSIAQDYSGNIYAGLEGYQPRPPAPPFGGGVYISSDSGRTWGSYGMSLTSINSFAVSKGGKVFILTPGAIIYSAALKSNKWTEDDAGIPYGPYGVDTIQTLLSDNLGEVVATSDIGVFVYSDSAASWKTVTPSISLTSITSAVYSPNGTTYAGTNYNGVFCLRSPSSTWVQCGIDPRPVTSIGFDGAGNLFAGTEDGVFEQALEGWLRVSDGLSHSTVYQLYYSASGKELYASTASGLFYLPQKGNYWNSLTQEWSYGLVESSNGDNYATTTGGILKEPAGEDIWAFIQTIGLPRYKHLLSRPGCVKRSLCGDIS